MKLVKVGNSRGLIIPAAILGSCGMKEAVDLQVSGKKLVITALDEPRAGWFDGYDPEKDDDVLRDIPPDEDTDDWEW